MTQRYCIELSYNGTDYHGWQYQPNCHSVQEELQVAIGKICRESIVCIGCGRTDAGVHAKQFFAHFELVGTLPENLVYKLNHLLPRNIAIHGLYQVPEKFSARYSCIERSYEYHIYFKPSPFIDGLSWVLFEKLDVKKMNQAAEILLTQNDFQSFCKAHSQVNNFICELRQAIWEVVDEDHIVFHITANRFLRNMVRSIVGSLVAVGSGTKSIEDFKELIFKKDRQEAGLSAPACGLYLSRVIYPEGLLTKV